jgi:extracellular elastinolytic metalloproteinase
MAIAPAFSLSGQPPEFSPDPVVQLTSSKAAAVNLQQYYLGIPVFDASVTVRFNPDGAIHETVGTVQSMPDDAVVSPAISAALAVAGAAAHVAEPDQDEFGTPDGYGQPARPQSVNARDYEPRPIATISISADLPTVFSTGPFAGSPTARLMWFVKAPGAVRLAWEVNLVMPGRGQRFRCIVDAENRSILYCRQLVLSVAAQGNVFQTDPSAARTIVTFPLDLSSYPIATPAGLPIGFPDDWVSADATSGNSTTSEMNGGGALAGDASSGTLTFDPANSTSDDQKILNAFYFMCFMHDYFYLLGFREADGNYQQDDLGRGGVGGDPATSLVFDGPVVGTANFGPTVDGIAATCQLGTVGSNPASNSTALDASVVYHEFTHGVSTRLVGARTNINSLDDPQSRGMGEGWSDFTSCTVLNTTVVGAWLVGQPGGIRSAPYDTNYPNHFDKLADPAFNNDEHNIGEVWCATLMEMMRNIGHDLAVQLVVDAMKLGPANPGFVQERDALFTALDNQLQAGTLSQQDHDQAKRGMWRAFARYGMGPAAQSNGAQLTGIVADFNVPSLPEVTGVSPASGSEAGGDQVTITGSGFTGATDVGFGATSAAVMSVDSDAQITATSPAGTGTVDVTVITPAGTSAAGPADQFTYTAALPEVTGVSPASGSEAGGDQVTITGSGFTGATDVGFGATSATAGNRPDLARVRPALHRLEMATRGRGDPDSLTDALATITAALVREDENAPDRSLLRRSLLAMRYERLRAPTMTNVDTQSPEGATSPENEGVLMSATASSTSMRTDRMLR